MANEANKQYDPDYFTNEENRRNLEESGIDVGRAQEFIRDNPGDYDRIYSALANEDNDDGAGHGDGGGGGGGSPAPAPTYAASTPYVPPPPPPPPPPLPEMPAQRAPWEMPNPLNLNVPGAQLPPEIQAQYAAIQGQLGDMSNKQQTREWELQGLDANRQNKSSALYDILQTRATQGTNIDPNDPIIKAQVDAFNADQMRANRDLISNAAESGRPMTDTQKAMAAERMGQAAGGLRAQLMVNELTNRRNEIASALNAQGAMLSDDQKVLAQQELANYDNMIKQQQLGLAATDNQAANILGFGNLGLQTGRLSLDNALGTGDLSLRAYQAQNANDLDRYAQQLQGYGLQNDVNLRQQGVGIQQQGIGLQAQDLDLRRELGRRQLEQQMTLADMQRQQFYDDLQSQNDRFSAQLGFNTADRSSYWDAIRRGIL